MHKAEEFYKAAQDLQTLADEPGGGSDAIVSLYVLAGVAASDVICCAKLGVIAKGQSHAEAVDLLGTANPGSQNHLRRLLEVKSKAEYTPTVTGQSDIKGAAHASGELLEQARKIG